MDYDENQSSTVDEAALRDWISGRAPPEIAKTIEDDLANEGPIYRKLTKSKNSPFLQMIDALVEANLNDPDTRKEDAMERSKDATGHTDPQGPQRFIGSNRSRHLENDGRGKEQGHGRD